MFFGTLSANTVITEPWGFIQVEKVHIDFAGTGEIILSKTLESGTDVTDAEFFIFDNAVDDTYAHSLVAAVLKDNKTYLMKLDNFHDYPTNEDFKIYEID